MRFRTIGKKAAGAIRVQLSYDCRSRVRLLYEWHEGCLSRVRLLYDWHLDCMSRARAMLQATTRPAPNYKHRKRGARKRGLEYLNQEERRRKKQKKKSVTLFIVSTALQTV